MEWNDIQRKTFVEICMYNAALRIEFLPVLFRQRQQQQSHLSSNKIPAVDRPHVSHINRLQL